MPVTIGEAGRDVESAKWPANVVRPIALNVEEYMLEYTIIEP
jgi:hypothetical protein